MFCPKCSQPQVSDEVRFCSRCGFQLAAVSQLLRNEEIAFMYPNYPKQRLPLIKRPEVRSGAKLIFLSIFLIIPSFILAVAIDHGLPLLAPLITFLVGAGQMIYYFLFGESMLPQKKQQSEFNENLQQFNFQPMQNLPFSVVDSKPFQTNEFAQNYNVSGRATNYMERH